MDVGVHREGGHVQREQHYDRGGFWSNTLETEQPAARLLRFELRQETQVKIFPLLTDLLQHLLNAWTLAVGQPGNADGVDYRFGFGITDLFPGWKPFPQGVKCPVAIDIIGVLGKYRGDEKIEGAAKIPLDWMAIDGQQPATDLSSELLLRIHDGIIATSCMFQADGG